MEWIDAREKPLCIPDEGDTWEITDAGASQFIALIRIEHNRVPENWMGWCYIDFDTFSLRLVGDEDSGWAPNDVDYYIPMPLPYPPTTKDKE